METTNTSKINKDFFNKQRNMGLLEIVFKFLNIEDHLRLFNLSKKVLSLIGDKIEVK